MKCIKCGSKTTVVSTIEYMDSVFRSRKCKECKYKFWTEEYEALDIDLAKEADKYRRDKHKAEYEGKF